MCSSHLPEMIILPKERSHRDMTELSMRPDKLCTENHGSDWGQLNQAEWHD